MRPTLIFVRHTDFGDRQFQHGDELPPRFLGDEAINKLLDSGRLVEYRERRSLYRLLHVFSGCTESEPLTDEEIALFSISSSTQQHGRSRAATAHTPPDLPPPPPAAAAHTGCTLL
jgi:hypothetical protein